MCLNNMKAKAGELGCSSSDMNCLCAKANYGYGIRDCTTEACPADNAAAVLSSALSSCPSKYSREFALLQRDRASC
jgi:hypothetical protein